MDFDPKKKHRNDYQRNMEKYIDKLHGSDYYYDPLPFVSAPFDCEVVEVLVKDNKNFITGQPMFKVSVPSNLLPFQTSSEFDKSKYKKVVDQHSRVGICIMEDALLDFIAAGRNTTSSPLATLDNEVVLKTYESFKKFGVVADHSDHLFSGHRPIFVMHKPEWASTIKEDRRILEEHLPENIFVRAYESRMDLLRAVIIGPKGTPYQDGLFVFDVLFPDKYPDCPPVVRYHSGGLAINPCMNHCGEVCLNLFTPTGEPEQLWRHGRNMLELLVYIQDLILNVKPFFNGFIDASFEGSVPGEWLSLLYNENTIIKSLKTMVYTMNKPPKNFEDLVFGHFHKHVRDILMACRDYIEGQQFGCLASDDSETCSIEFKNDVASFIKPLVDAFKKIGANEAQEFLQLIKKRKATDENIDDTTNKKKQDIDICRGSDHCYVSWNVFSNSICTVSRVMVKNGTRVKKGEFLYVVDLKTTLKEAITPICSSAITKILYRNSRSRVGIFSMEDVLLDQDDPENSPMAGLDDEDVLKRYENFKKFESVMDHADHFFSAQGSLMNQLPKEWSHRIHEEWKILEEDLPENIFVRVYESRIDLLRAVIIGPEGTPYHGGLFFFDVCFPSNYPNSPPNVHYRSGGLGINPNLYKCGKVRLSLPKPSGGHETMWVPSTSTMLQLLVSLQNQVLNTKPLFNDPTYAFTRDSLFGEQCSFLYNENTLIKSLKTMSYTLNDPPKNFEDFVPGHFCKCARDIMLMACSKKCSKMYKDDLLSCLNPLLDAFRKTGVKEDQLSIWGKKQE